MCHGPWAMISSRHVKGRLASQDFRTYMVINMPCEPRLVGRVAYNISQKIIKHPFSAMAPCRFLTYHISCLSHRKTCWTMSVEELGLEICSFGPRPSWSLCHFVLGVNQNGPGTSSTTNQHSQCLGTTSWSMVYTSPKF